MSSRVQFGFLALSCALLASCQVYPDPHTQPPGPNQPGIAPMTPEQMELQKQRDEKKKLEAEKKKAEEALKQTPPTGGEEIKPKPTKEKKDYPFANAVPGKEGFVFSPYNNQMVDVRGIASGTLVQDPTYQADEKKYFRVP